MSVLFEDEETPEKITLKGALRLLRIAVPKRTTLPILRKICVHSDGDTASMDGTDLSQWVHLDSVDIQCPIGVWLVDFDKFLAGLPLEQIMEPENGDFPTYARAGGDEFSAKWIPLLPNVSFAMSTDGTRISLNGVVVEPSAIGATDGHRAVFLKVETGAPSPFILAAESVYALERIKGSPESCAVDDRTIHVRFPWGFYGGRLVEGPYPNWRQLDRRDHTYRVQVPRKAVMDWCSRIPQAARGTNAINSLHLQIFRGHTIGVAAMSSGEHLDLGRAPSSGGPADSHPIVVGMNPRYLYEIVSKLPGSHIVLGICAPLQAVFLNPDSENIYIQMPLRVGRDV